MVLDGSLYFEAYFLLGTIINILYDKCDPGQQNQS